MLRLSFNLFLFTFLLTPWAVSANEVVPNDIRYMLEDMYGANKNEWPALRYKKDLNKDGYIDWVAEKNSCQSKTVCPADLFICIPNKTGSCSEYCYIEVKDLRNIESDLKLLKCGSTC
jgi:capsid portal protein